MKNAEYFHGLEIIDVIDFKRQKTSYHTNKRNFNVLSIRASGEAEFVQNKRVKVTEDNLLFIPKNIEYSQSTEGEHVLGVHFKGRSPYEEIMVFDINANEAKKLFIDMIKLFRQKTEVGFYMAHCRLYEILALAANEACGNSFRDKITVGYEEIRMNYACAEFRIEDIVQKIGVSGVYFRREFKKRYGISPKQMLNDLRLSNSALLLENGYCSVSEAALQCGFSDPNYFSAVFKKHFGVAPSQYMKE